MKPKWAVVAICTAKNNGKIEEFKRIIATFICPTYAEDFINKCLPKENRNRFSIVNIDSEELL